MGMEDVTDRYTYRITWSEQLLQYVISCDEYTLRYVRHADAEYLLDYTRDAVHDYVEKDRKQGYGVSAPIRPVQSAAIARRCMERAELLAAGQVPDDSRTDVFRPWEREILESMGRLDPEDRYLSRDLVELSDARIRRRLSDAFAGLHAMLLAETAQAFARGDDHRGRRLNQVRLAVGESYLRIGPYDRRKMTACTDRYLHETARHALMLDLRDGIPEDGPVAMRLIAADPRSRRKTLAHAIRRTQPWAGPLAGMPEGWMIRFGPELMDDMRQVINLGLNGFAIEQVKEKWGGLRVLFDDDPFDQTTGLERPDKWMDLAELMHGLLDLYEALSTCTCIRCGSQYQVRVAYDGWAEPLCHRCWHTRILNQELRPDRRVPWKRMEPLEAGESLTDWAVTHHPGLATDRRLDGLHILPLLRRCVNEQVGFRQENDDNTARNEHRTKTRKGHTWTTPPLAWTPAVTTRATTARCWTRCSRPD